jgi:hypothetical protein
MNWRVAATIVLLLVLVLLILPALFRGGSSGGGGGGVSGSGWVAPAQLVIRVEVTTPAEVYTTTPWSEFTMYAGESRTEYIRLFRRVPWDVYVWVDVSADWPVSASAPRCAVVKKGGCDMPLSVYAPSSAAGGAYAIRVTIRRMSLGDILREGGSCICR